MKRDEPKLKVCPHCEGYGERALGDWRDPSTEVQTCYECDGSGLVEDEDCETCEGTGKIDNV